MPVLLDLFGEKEETRNPRVLYHYSTVIAAKRATGSASTRKIPPVARVLRTVPPTDSESLQSVPGHGYQLAPPRSVLDEQHIDPPINT